MLAAVKFETHASRRTQLGPLDIWRALPTRGRRMIGAWCFLDRYGPISFSSEKPMDVATHPHIGIQTVSWLLEGEVVHHDSIGCEGVVRPGGVNVMTSGRGIAHAEETPASNVGRLNGVQLWIALPDASRNIEPSFQHVPEVPVTNVGEVEVRVFTGEAFGVASPAQRFSDLVGADVSVHGETTLPLDPTFEYGIFTLDGDDANTLYYLPPGESELTLKKQRVLLLGGKPFGEQVLMWWNFVARTRDDIAAAREDWQAGRRFGDVPQYKGPRLHAPALMRLAEPNPAS